MTPFRSRRVSHLAARGRMGNLRAGSKRRLLQMKKVVLRRWLIIAITFLSAAVFVLILSPTQSEPTFENKCLSEWLDRYAAPEERTNVARALASMGSNAIPCLLRKASVKDSSLAQRTKAILARARFFGFRYYPAHWEHERAVRGFSLLGPLAQSAIPELERMLDRDQNASVAAPCLAGVGPLGISVLRKKLNHKNPNVRARVALALGDPQLVDENLDTELLALLKDSDPGVRARTARSLGFRKRSAETVVPALACLLDDANAQVRLDAAWALGHFGSGARRQLQVLKSKAANDPDAGVRRFAQIAVRQIASGNDDH
jgi:HEAT repeat protein